MEVEEPRDSEFLIRAEQRGEGGWERRGGERGEIAESGGAGAPGGGRLEVRGDFLEERLGDGGAGGTDRVRAACGETAGAGDVAGEGALRGVEFLEFVGGEE